MRLGFLGQKAIAIVAGGALVSMAAVGAFASQDFTPAAEDTPTVEVTETATETATATEEPTETATAEPTETATAEPTEEATEEPTEEATEEPTEEPTEEATEEPEEDEGEDGQREVGGIPEDNPVFGEDGKCAAIKTTPSGRQVRVPCHAAGVDDEGATQRGNGKPKKNGGDE